MEYRNCTNKDYEVVPIVAAKDNRLSNAAKGVYYTLMVATDEQFINRTLSGAQQTNTIQELVDCGYLIIDGEAFHIYDKPQEHGTID